jgi:hypothetical protein
MLARVRPRADGKVKGAPKAPGGVRCPLPVHGEFVNPRKNGPARAVL